LDKKRIIIDYWDRAPCGTRGFITDINSKEFFTLTERRRYELEPFIPQKVHFERWQGKKVLEIGCGTGIDALQFLRQGAKICAIDFSKQSVNIARNRVSTFGFNAQCIFVADAERLPFSDNQFDLVYSWGVLHHTPNIEKAVTEIYRVVRPSGKICIMLYHKPSLVALQLYLLFGLFALRPFRGIDEIIARHLESPGTKAYTRPQARRIFKRFGDLKIDSVLTKYDFRYKRDRYKRDKFLPGWVEKLIPNSLGWFMVIRGLK
jgi:ubiquinone/menaquinone biosynthesis C-methylase UbiE